MNIRQHARAGIVAAIVAFSVLAGTVASYAYWSATAQASLGNGAATLATTATGWATTTLGNENVSATSSNALTSTGSVTITNTTSTTSSQNQALSSTFSRASGSTVLASATTLTVWSVASAALCTTAAIPTSPTSATWTAGVTVTATLAPGASVIYCLRNTVADRQNADDPSGTLTFSPQVASTLSISNFTKTTTATSTISTQYIYPLADFTSGYWYYIKRATDWCWDVSGSGTGSPSVLISYACKNNTDTNQDFRFMDADGDGYGDFQARHTTALRVEAAASTTSGSAVDMRTAATTTAVQQWQPQLVAAGTYQFVNKYSGLCLSMPAVSAGVATQVTCSGGADQKFTLTKRGVIGITNFACVNLGSSGANRTVTYSWNQDYSGGPYLIQARQNASSLYQTIATSANAAATSVSVAAPIGAPLTTWGGSLFGSTYSVQIVNDDGEVVGSGQIVLYNNLFYDYARCT